MLNTQTLIELLAPLPASTRVTVLEGDKLIRGVVATAPGVGLDQVAVLVDVAPRGPWLFRREDVEPVEVPNVIKAVR